jgi:hypothetical protein
MRGSLLGMVKKAAARVVENEEDMACRYQDQQGINLIEM